MELPPKLVSQGLALTTAKEAADAAVVAKTAADNAASAAVTAAQAAATDLETKSASLDAERVKYIELLNVFYKPGATLPE